MKRTLFFAAALFATSMAWADVNPKPFVIPELSSWQGAEGKFVPSGRVVVLSKQLAPVAQAFVGDYKTMFSTQLTIVKGAPAAGDFVFTLQKEDAANPLGEEGYTLEVSDKALVSAVTTKGAYWATRTMLQISEQTTSRTLPCGVTTDVPAYPMRGFMMDCGRK